MSVAITKQDFEIFSRPILEQLKLLELGYAFQIENSLKILNFFLLYVFDKPARALVLHTISCNGLLFAYKFCENNPSGPLRKKESYVEDCENQVHGIKGRIGLSELRFFQPLHNTNIDHMHTVLEGVVKRFFGPGSKQSASNQSKHLQ